MKDRSWDCTVNANFEFQYVDPKFPMMNIENFIKQKEESDCLCREGYECDEHLMKRLTKELLECTCGAKKCGSNKHSDWCNLYEK